MGGIEITMSETPFMQRALNPTGKVFSLSVQRGRGTIIDELLVMLWLVAIPLEFPMASAFRYPAALLVLLAAFVYRHEVFPILKRGSVFFALPALCLLSTLWSDAPFSSIRFGLFMALGLVICAYTAARLDQRQFVIAVLLTSAVLCLASLLFMRTTFVGGLDGGWAVIGVFPHKNVLGVRMLVLVIAALAVLLGKGYERHWRLLALLVLVPAIFLIIKSNSATALVLLLGGGAMIASLGGLWRPASHVRGLRSAMAALALITLAGGGLIAANIYKVNPYTTLLEKLGKNENLTGRTYIWDVANKVIAERPVVGVGAGAFWRPGVNQATRIATTFNAVNNQFYFHNTYYEATVHLGFIGFIVFLLSMGIAYKTLIINWLQHQNSRDGFFITIATILFLRSFTESELFSVFLMNPMIFWTGVFMALQQPLLRQPSRL